MSDTEFISLDVETTGLSPEQDRIVEIAAVKFSMDGTVIDTFSTLTNPQIPIPSEATEKHRITDDMVKDKMLPLEAWNKILDWAGDATTFIAHNAWYDAFFLRELKSQHPKLSQVHFIDTLHLSRNRFPDAPSHKLTDLVPRDEENSHRALPDAMATIALFIEITGTYKSGEIPSSYIINIRDIEEPKASWRQLSYIENLGGNPSLVKTKREASAYIDKLRGDYIEEDAAPTSKQLNYIKGLGGNPALVETKQEASQYIDELKGYGIEEDYSTEDDGSIEEEFSQPASCSSWVWAAIVIIFFLYLLSR